MNSEIDFPLEKTNFCVANVLIFQVILVPSGIMALPDPLIISGFLCK